MFQDTTKIGTDTLQLFSGMSGAAVTGEIIKGAQITGDPKTDIFIKVFVPIITGVLIPVVQQWLLERRQRRAERKENKK